LSEHSLVDAADERRLGYEGWRVAGASAVGVFFASILIYGFAVLLKPLAEEFGWSREMAASAYAVMAVAAALSAPAFGVLLDRLGPTWVAIPCLAICGCGIASLAALTASRVHAYALFTLLGLSVMGASPLAYSRAVSTWFDRRRGAALAIVLAGAAVASITHPPLVDTLIGAIGWRRTCFALGLLVLGIGLPVVIGFVREQTANPSLRHDEGVSSSVARGLRSWVFWVLVIVIAGASLANNAVVVHLPALLTDRGVSSSRAALALSIMGVASLLGRIITGWLIDRLRASWVGAALIAVAAFGIFLLHDASSWEAAVIAGVLIGFGMGGELDIAPFLLSRYFGLRVLATLYGFIWMIMGCAAAAGSILMGRAFDASGSYDGMLVRLSISTAAVAALLLVLPGYDLAIPEQSVRGDRPRSGR
jgi:predicted MFS family arabinose efflux permease